MPTSAAAAAGLGCRIEAGLIAQHWLLSGPHDATMAADLEVVAADGRVAAEQLFLANLDLVDAIAERHEGRGLEQADVVQEGRIGLLRAVAEFDWAGQEFATAAAWWIRRAVRQAIHDHGRDGLPSTAEAELGMPALRARHLAGGPPELVSMDAPAGSADPDDAVAPEPISALLHDPDDPSTEGLALAALDSAALDAALTELGDPASTVVRCRFGLGPGPPMSLMAASRATGMAPERVRQCEDRAIRHLRDRGRARLLA